MDGRRLLLLDNDERIVELLTWYLGERGFAVRHVSTFADARAAIAAERPDLFVSDVDLGTESAVEQLPRMSAAGELPPTLVVSGYLDARVRKQLDAVPEVLDTLAKPFEFADLEERVEACLRLAAAGLPAEAPRAAPAAGAAAGPKLELASEAGDDDDGWIEITPRG